MSDAIEDVGSLDPYLTAIVLKTNLALYDHYVPQTVNVGLAFRRDDTLTAYLDGRWHDWRGFENAINVARVGDTSVAAPFIDIDDNIVDGNDVQPTFRSVWSLRAGADLRLPQIALKSALRYIRISARGGFGYIPTPLVSQTEDSALLDTDRTMITFGVGAETWDPLDLADGPVRFDTFFQLHTLARGSLARETDVPRAGYPVNRSALPVGGNIIVIGGSFGFDY